MVDLKQCPKCRELFWEGKICEYAGFEGKECEELAELSRQLYEGKISVGEYAKALVQRFGIDKAKKVLEGLEKALMELRGGEEKEKS